MVLVCDQCGEPIVDTADATLEWDMIEDKYQEHNMRVLHKSTCASETPDRDAPLSFYVGVRGARLLRSKVDDNQLSNDEVESLITRLESVL